METQIIKGLDGHLYAINNGIIVRIQFNPINCIDGGNHEYGDSHLGMTSQMRQCKKCKQVA